jgi:uncharacterized protein (TIGR02757 family)
MCAYGRVDLFAPVVERVLAHADARGGPAALARTWGDADARALHDVQYRWNHPADFHALFALLGRVLAERGSVGALFVSGPARESLSGAIDALRARGPAAPSRGLRTWLPSPRDGSACKRWLMLLRWMVRRDEVDPGGWTHLSPGDLVIPLDTHTGRISRLLGLTRRANADWAAAEEVTQALGRLDPADPVRFDFALAHLGISGGCRGSWVAPVCGACAVAAACRVGRRGGTSPFHPPPSE